MEKDFVQARFNSAKMEQIVFVLIRISSMDDWLTHNHSGSNNSLHSSHICPNPENNDTCKMICQLFPINGIRFLEKDDTLEKCQYLPANATMDAGKSICIILNCIYKQKYASSPP